MEFTNGKIIVRSEKKPKRFKLLKKVCKYAIEIPNGGGSCNWVTRYKLLGFITLYKISNRWSLFKPKGFKELHKAIVTDSTIYITEEEFKKEYNNNKWILPLNVKIK